MSIAEAALVPASVLDDLGALEPLARRVFGAGHRSPGWFARKLHRECVVPELSRVVVSDASDPTRPETWLGYGLLGCPPSLGGGRTAGIGLVAEARGHGLGTRLVGSLLRAARDADLPELRVPAPPDRVPFYVHAGLVAGRRTQTWLTFGRGSGPVVSPQPPQPWNHATELSPISGWFAEAWDRTPTHQRYTAQWTDDDAQRHQLDVSIEGTAHVVQRWQSTAPRHLVARGLNNWLDGLAEGTPALLHEVDTVSSVTEQLRTRGWSVVQEAVEMRCELATLAQ